MSAVNIFLLFLISFLFISPFDCLVTPSCVEQAEGCMCPLIKKILELKKASRAQEKLLKKWNKAHPKCSTTTTTKAPCVPQPPRNNALCPIVQKVVDCWESASACESLDDIKLINDIETLISTSTNCDIKKLPCYAQNKHGKNKTKKLEGCS